MFVDPELSSTRSHFWLGCGLLLGGLVCLGLTASMNYLQGEMMGVTAAGKWVNSLSSVVVDIVGLLLFGLAAGACWRARAWAPACIFTLVMLASAGWSINSMMSFQATERVSAAKMREATLARDAEVDTFAKGHAKWLRDQVTRREATTRAERKDFLAAASGEITKLREAKLPDRVQPDAGASAWAVMTNHSVQQITIVQVAYLSVLLILLKVVCFPSSSFFLTAGFLAKRQATQGRGGKNDPERSKEPEDSRATSPQKEGQDVPPKSVPLRLVADTVVVATPKGPLPLRQPIDEYLQEQLARGRKLDSQIKISQATGWSQPVVSKRLAKLERQGKINRERAGNMKSVRQRIGDGGSARALAGG